MDVMPATLTSDCSRPSFCQPTIHSKPSVIGSHACVVSALAALTSQDLLITKLRPILGCLVLLLLLLYLFCLIFIIRLFIRLQTAMC